MNVTIAGNILFTLNFNAINGLTEAYASSNTAKLPYSEDIVKVDVDFNNKGNPSAKAFLDYIEVLGKKN